MLKYLLLILVISGVWYGFRYVNRGSSGGDRPPQPAPKPEARPQMRAEDMTACRVCGTYVAESTAKSCGRADCPYPAG